MLGFKHTPLSGDTPLTISFTTTPLDLAKAKEKLAELEMKKIEQLLTAKKAYLLVQELTGELNIENAVGRLSKME